MSNSLDDIIRCDIEIAAPATSGTSLNTILMVVPPPGGAGEGASPDVTVITQANDLLSYGFAVNHVAYKAASVAYSQSPAPGEICIAVRKKNELNEYESIDETLNRAIETNIWYGIYLASFVDSDSVNAAKEWAESHSKLFCFDVTDMNEYPIVGKEYYRTFGIYSGSADGYDVLPEANRYAGLAWMVKCFGYEPGSETWAFKTLSTISPSKLTSVEKQFLEDNNISYYCRYAGKNIVSNTGGKVLAGEWIDIIRFRDWLKNDMQMRIFNLFALSRKVPYDDSGIAAVELQMIASLKAGQEAGGISRTYFDSDDNEVPGYTVTVPAAASLTDEQKASRKLTGCKFTARLAGAIHMVDISGNLVY